MGPIIEYSSVVGFLFIQRKSQYETLWTVLI